MAEIKVIVKNLNKMQFSKSATRYLIINHWRIEFLDWEGLKGRGLTGDLDGRNESYCLKNLNKM